MSNRTTPWHRRLPQFARERRARIVASILPLAFGTPALGQAFVESFDAVGRDSGPGPANLLADGFSFTKVLAPGLTDGLWKQGPWHAGQPAAWEGTGFLSGNIAVDPFTSASYAKWIIFPVVPGQTAGQIVSTWVRGFTSEFPIAGSVQIRYSPSGGTATGSTATSVGDFTELLTQNTNGSMSGWDHLQAALPGTGRVALRWVGTINGGFSGTSLDLLIDDLTITSDGVTPPLPQPGETVHWTAAMSPIHLVNQQVIPAGGTLIVDAGVEIYFDFTAPLFVGAEMTVLGGTLRFEGTAESPIVLRRGINTTEVPMISVGSGLLSTVGTAGSIEAMHVDADVSFLSAQSGFMRLRNCSISRETPIDWASMIDSQYHVPTVTASKSTAVIEDSTFTNAIAQANDAMMTVTGCTFDDGLLRVHRFPIAQETLIAGNTFIKSDEIPPIELSGYDFHLIDNVIVGNVAPLALRGGGLSHDSDIPASGNTTDRILLSGAPFSEVVGPMSLPPMSVPYLLESQWTAGDQYDGRVTIEAGTTIEMGPDAALFFEGVARTEIDGTPEAPVRFLQRSPGQRWTTVSAASVPPLIIRHAIFEGGRWATGGTDTLFFVHDCEFVDNEIGVQAGDLCAAVVSKSRFVDNDIGVFAPWAGLSGIDQGRFFDYGAENDNAFEGSGIGAATEPPTVDFSFMKNAWWGNSSGPDSIWNPSGTGSDASDWVNVLPFRTTPVNFSDHPPVVASMPVAERRIVPNSKIILHWNARDDGSIVSQRLEFRPTQGFGSGVVVVPSIPPSARSVEIEVPDTLNGVPGLGSDGGIAVFRIIAVDDAGQEGFDDFSWRLVTDTSLSASFTTDLSGGFRVGENFDVHVSLPGGLPYHLYIDDLPFDWQDLGTSGFPSGEGGIVASSNTMPAVSTDLARYGAIVFGEVFYSEYFTIRPAELFGDAPPSVSLLTPTAGAEHAGGSTVMVTWTASDDVALRGFDLQASYDGGLTWHPFALSLPGSSTSYAWTLPSSSGIDDVRVRVIARDTRFQTTSDGTERSFRIVAGNWTECPTDLSGDGTVDAADLAVLLGSWGGSGLGDIDGDGVVGGADLALCLGAWGPCD